MTQTNILKLKSSFCLYLGDLKTMIAPGPTHFVWMMELTTFIFWQNYPNTKWTWRKFIWGQAQGLYRSIKTLRTSFWWLAWIQHHQVHSEYYIFCNLKSFGAYNRYFSSNYHTQFFIYLFIDILTHKIFFGTLKIRIFAWAQ